MSGRLLMMMSYVETAGTEDACQRLGDRWHHLDHGLLTQWQPAS